MSIAGKQIVSTLAADGTLTVELTERELPDPAGSQVLVRMEAAPINPSDLGLLFGPADVANAKYEPGRIVARMPEGAVRAMAGRIGQPMPVGNEGAGTVIAAGGDPAAQALVGQRVACVTGQAYSDHVLVDSQACLPLGELSAEQGASAYVNPMTVLGFVETMRMEGFTGLIHTAAASNLGQMLVRLCQEENIPLVNIVRSPEQVALLRGLGAKHVVDAHSDGFRAELIDAIGATGATLAFDAIGGGTLAGQILDAMEAWASSTLDFSRYGSNVWKQVYNYGLLDTGPTIVNRTFGFQWGLSGWLLTPFLAKAGAERRQAMQQRVLTGLTTTFASTYKARVTLEGMLTQGAVLAYNAKRTGEKYLVLPSG